MDYAGLEASFVRWAQARPEVLGVALIGSRARSDHPADEWSDLDLVIFTTDAEVFAASGEWLDELGEVWLRVMNRLGSGDPEWLVLFEDMVKGDFAFTTAPPGATTLAEMAAAFPFQDVFARGARVLVDKTPHPGGDLRLTKIPAPPLPSPDEFQQAVQAYLYNIVRAARLLRRGDLWRAHSLCDCELKQGLLQMLEWQARLEGEAGKDTWHEGRFLDEWASPQALAALPATFATFDSKSLWDALFASLELYRSLAQEYAAARSWELLPIAFERVRGWLEETRPAG